MGFGNFRFGAVPPIVFGGIGLVVVIAIVAYFMMNSSPKPLITPESYKKAMDKKAADDKILAEMADKAVADQMAKDKAITEAGGKINRPPSMGGAYAGVQQQVLPGTPVAVALQTTPSTIPLTKESVLKRHSFMDNAIPLSDLTTVAIDIDGDLLFVDGSKFEGPTRTKIPDAKNIKQLLQLKDGSLVYIKKDNSAYVNKSSNILQPSWVNIPNMF
jgi:hypothetical protein